MTGAQCVGLLILAGMAMGISGCTNKRVKTDLLRLRDLPATVPEGAEPLGKQDAKIVEAVHPERTGSKISWRHPLSGLTINLHLGEAHAYPRRGNSSRFEIASGDFSSGSLVVPSLVTKAWCEGRGFDVLPRVHFSSSGKTALVEEDISDASPIYNNLLFVADADSGRVQERILKLPRRKTAMLYGIPANVLSITDEDVTLAFPFDKLYFKMQFDRIDDVERQFE